MIFDRKNRHCQQILDSIADGVYLVSAERKILFWNKGAERITGHSADVMIGKACYNDLLRTSGGMRSATPAAR